MSQTDQLTNAEIAVFTTLDAIATMPGLSILIGYGTPAFDNLVNAAAEAEGQRLTDDEQRRLYWFDYVERRGLKRSTQCT